MTERFTLRPAAPADEPFLRALYASTREPELAPLGWSQAELDAFLDLQFRARTAHYEALYPDAEDCIVLVDGAPVGRLDVRRGEEKILIVDLALEPEQRGRGIGTAVLGDLIAEAAEAGKPLELHVEANNPARRLYLRLGFIELGEAGVYVRMRRGPG